MVRNENDLLVLSLKKQEYTYVHRIFIFCQIIILCYCCCSFDRTGVPETRPNQGHQPGKVGATKKAGCTASILSCPVKVYIILSKIMMTKISVANSYIFLWSFILHIWYSKKLKTQFFLLKSYFYIFRYTVSVRVEEKQPYRQRTYTWCWNFPPRCSKYKIQIKTIYRTEVRNTHNHNEKTLLFFREIYW